MTLVGKNKVIQGDCVEVMKTLPAASIDLVVTSPPYDNLREYGGYSFDFEATAKELCRLLKPGGVIVWVVGDATVNGSETGTSFKQALYFKELGLNLHDTMIYRKQFYLPLTHNRYEQEFEYMFVLSKGKPKFFNPIKATTLFAGKKNTTTHRRDKQELSDASGYGKERKEERIIGNVFTYQPERGSKHPAAFPERLAKDHITSWSNEGDVVLDPFLGSGTTAKAAKDLNRDYIGIEINPDYCKIAEERLRQEVLL